MLLSGSLEGRVCMWDTAVPGAWECAAILDAVTGGEEGGCG